MKNNFFKSFLLIGIILFSFSSFFFSYQKVSAMAMAPDASCIGLLNFHDLWLPPTPFACGEEETGGGGGLTVRDDATVEFWNADKTSKLTSIPLLAPGQTYSFIVLVKNTGTTAWYHGNAYELVDLSPRDSGGNPYFSLGGRGWLPIIIYDGQSQDFPKGANNEIFTITAPSTPGTYELKMGMVRKSGSYQILSDDVEKKFLVMSGPSSSEVSFGQQASISFTVSSGQGPSLCTITSFSAGSTTLATGTGTTLYYTAGITGSPARNVTVTAPATGGVAPTVATSTSTGGSFTTGNLSGTQTYRLTCGGDTRDLTVFVGTFPVSGSCWDWPSPKVEVNTASSTGYTYTLQRRLGSGSWADLITNVSFNDFDHYVDSAVSAGSTYDYRIVKTSGTNFSTSDTLNMVISEANCSNIVSPSVPPVTACGENALVTIIEPLPATMAPGEVAPFTMRVKDTGDTRWYNGSYFKFINKSASTLPVISIAPSNVAGEDYGHLPYGVYPNETIDWRFNVTAPTTPGSFSLDMQMKHLTGGNYLKADGTTCPAPTVDTFFGGVGTVSSVVSEVPPTTYTVTFDGNGHTGGTMAPQIFSPNTTANLTANGFTKTGYNFAGWATSSSGAVAYANSASYTMGDANVTLFAKWTTTTAGANLTAGVVVPTTATLGTPLKFFSTILYSTD